MTRRDELRPLAPFLFEGTTVETAALFAQVFLLHQTVNELVSVVNRLNERLEGIAETNNLWDGS